MKERQVERETQHNDLANFDTLGTGVYLCFSNILSDFNPHDHDYYEIFIILNGVLKHRINGQEQICKEGDILYIRPQDAHLLTSDVGSYITNIAFSKEVMKNCRTLLGEEQFKHYDEGRMPTIRNIDKKQLTPILDRIYLAATVQFGNMEYTINLKNVLVELLSIYLVERKKVRNDVPSWLMNAYNEIQNPACLSQGMKVFYQLANRTQEHTAREFRKYFNLTITEYINQLRVRYAKNLLVTTDKPIAEIGFEVGYENLNYFYKRFKKEEGLSPLKYRQKYKVKMI